MKALGQRYKDSNTGSKFQVTIILS
jgi:hypothetical protein